MGSSPPGRVRNNFELVFPCAVDASYLHSCEDWSLLVTIGGLGVSDNRDQDDGTRDYVLLRSGTMVDQFRIIERIGGGGMGEVYLADDTKLARRLALKFLSLHLVSDQDAKARFMREARAVAKLDHPNVVTVHEVGEFEGRPYFAMQYIEGKSLHHFCQEEPLSINKIVNLSIQICEGLEKAHQRGIIHRDIKTSNVLVDLDLRPRILDFGLAALEGGEKLTKVGSTIGTVAYMSPEQAQGIEVDHRSDLFSFGVVLYELVTGRTPFKRENDAATLKAIVNDDSEPLARFRANVPEELQRIVSKLLEREPSLRYQTASGVIADLKKLSVSSSSGRVVPVSKKSSRVWMYVAILTVLVAVAAYVQFLRRAGDEQFTPLTSMMITLVTDHGKIVSAAISPDGNYLAYIKDDAGIYSLWIKQVVTGSSMEIAEPNRRYMHNVTFSPDGNFVYYTVQDSNMVDNLYRIPALGGVSTPILTDVGTRISFSPDGARMAFCRPYHETGEFAVMVSDADGGNVKKLAARKVDEWYWGAPAWSPDGKYIACPKGYINPQWHYDVVVLDVVTGDESQHLSGDWNSTSSPCWLPDSEGLLFGATSRSSFRNNQIWHVPHRGEKPQRITNDLNSYSELSLTSNGDKLAAVQNDARAGVWIVPGGTADQAKQLAFGKYDGINGLAWVDQKIVYSTFSVGKSSFYAVTTHGSAPQELIASSSPIFSPSVSPDRQFIVFVDLTEGIPSIWRVDTDGRNRKRLSASGAESYSPQVSPDGKWIVFDSWEAGPQTVMKMPVEGGEHVPLTRPGSSDPAISPDGLWVACILREAQTAPYKIALVPFEGGDPVKLFTFPATALSSLRWLPDGSAIAYIDTREGVSNIWSQPVNGGTPRQVTGFKEDLMADFSWSPDGKDLAVCRYTYSNDVVLISNFR